MNYLLTIGREPLCVLLFLSVLFYFWNRVSSPQLGPWLLLQLLLQLLQISSLGHHRKVAWTVQLCLYPFCAYLILRPADFECMHSLWVPWLWLQPIYLLFCSIFWSTVVLQTHFQLVASYNGGYGLLLQVYFVLCKQGTWKNSQDEKCNPIIHINLH